MTGEPPREQPARRPSGAPELPDVLRSPPEPTNAARPNESRISSLAVGMALGADFLGSIAGGLILGWLADRWLGSQPVGVLVGLVIGMSLAMIRIVRRSQSMNPPTRTRQKPARPGRQSGDV